MKDCGICGGTGERLTGRTDTPSETCYNCSGSGKVNDNNIYKSTSSGTCFSGGTPVLTANAVWTAISDVQSGDDVLTLGQAGEMVTAPVKKRVCYSTGRIWKITTELNSHPIKTTAWHAFATSSGRCSAWRLRAGMCLLHADGTGKLAHDRVISVERTALFEPVYNLIVSNEFSFIAQGVLAYSFGVLGKERERFHKLCDRFTRPRVILGPQVAAR